MRYTMLYWQAFNSLLQFQKVIHSITHFDMPLKTLFLDLVQSSYRYWIVKF